MTSTANGSGDGPASGAAQGAQPASGPSSSRPSQAKPPSPRADDAPVPSRPGAGREDRPSMLGRIRRPRMKLARQVWLLLAFPIALALGLFGIAQHEIRQRLLDEEASAEMLGDAELLEAAVIGPLERNSIHVLHERMNRLALNERILGIGLFMPDGTPYFITQQLSFAAGELSEIARRAAATDRELQERHVFQDRSALVQTVTFSETAKHPAAIAVIARDMKYLDHLFNVLDRGLVLTGAIVLAIALIVVGVVTRTTVGAPVRTIVEGVERVAAGELDVKVPEEGVEEIARLAQAFNAMTASLAEARAHVEAEEAARVAVERKLQQAQALAAAGQVAASLGHEIGSPLNVILGRAMRAAGLPSCPEEIRKELQTIAVQSERISRVVSQLLAVARPQQNAGKSSDLVRVAEDVMAFLAPECRQRRVQASIERTIPSARVSLDADRLFQVVFNLAMNAVEAQDGGGELMLRVLRAPAKGESQARFALEIEDRGPGVPPDIAEHLFEPFFTTKRGGSGLGLAIVKGMVREAGGTIEVVPAPRGGALFRVTFPEDTLGGPARATEVSTS